MGGTYRKFDENNFQLAKQGVHGCGHPVFCEVILYLSEITGDFMTNVIGEKINFDCGFAGLNKTPIFEVRKHPEKVSYLQICCYSVAQSINKLVKHTINQ